MGAKPALVLGISAVLTLVVGVIIAMAVGGDGITIRESAVIRPVRASEAV
jgi:hypothetical protein